MISHTTTDRPVGFCRMLDRIGQQSIKETTCERLIAQRFCIDTTCSFCIRAAVSHEFRSSISCMESGLLVMRRENGPAPTACTNWAQPGLSCGCKCARQAQSMAKIEDTSHAIWAEDHLQQTMKFSVRWKLGARVMGRGRMYGARLGALAEPHPRPSIFSRANCFLHHHRTCCVTHCAAGMIFVRRSSLLDKHS